MHSNAFNESSGATSLKDTVILIAAKTGGLGSPTVACLSAQKARLFPGERYQHSSSEYYQKIYKTDNSVDRDLVKWGAGESESGRVSEIG